MFQIYSPWITDIVVSHDLERLSVIPDKKSAKKIHDALFKGLSKMPTFLSIETNDQYITVTDLVDIQLELDKLRKRAAKEDPIFLENLNNATDEKSLNIDMMTKSTLRTTITCLEVCRVNGMNHAIESPLKALNRAGLLTQQHDLNQILVSLYPIISANRAEYEKKFGVVKLPDSGEPAFAFSLSPRGV